MIRNTTQKVNADYGAKFDTIFGDKPIQRGVFVQDESGAFVPKGLANENSVNAPMIMKPLNFVSPITREVISSRAQLARHNKTHGVTNSADYSGGYIERKANERNAAGEKHLKVTRRSDINHAIERHS